VKRLALSLFYVLAENWNSLDTVQEKTYSYLLVSGSSMSQVWFLWIFLIILNFVSFAVFGIDKLNSQGRSWRVPESRLLLIAFFGPFGAYAGMLLFRHKTRKIKFLIVPIFLFIQGLLIAYFYFIK
jgi:uncharacterized membrane protein YsdA (DUF1294 family)